MIGLKIILIHAALTCDGVTLTLELRGVAEYNQSFDLVCFTLVTEDPYAIFFRTPGELRQIATVVYDKSLNSCNRIGIGFTNYSYSCSNEGKNITLTVPAENEAEHNTFWQCTNKGSESEYNNNVVHVFVNDPVRNVTIGNNTVVTVTEGVSEIFICESSPCRPSADIFWMKNGFNITNPNATSIIRTSGTKNITTSSLRFNSSRKDNGSLLACDAYNGYGTRKVSANVTVIVHYSPSVNPFPSPVKVIQGQQLVVVCSADGNPSPQLTWNPAGEDSVNRSRLYYSAISRDKAVIHRCNATNNITSNIGSPQTGSDSKEFLIDVLYSPIVNPFTSPVKVIQGRPLVVVCSADGNPTSQLSWNPAGEDGVNKSRLYYSAISRDKAVIHSCNATNNMAPTMGSPQTGSDSKELLIDVLYSPVVNPFTSPIKVIQGQPLVVMCSADGNPSPQLTWNPVGEDRLNRSRLYYSAISRDKAVIHRCNATNIMAPNIGSQEIGSDSKEVLIDVLYSPAINSFTSPMKVIEGQPLVAICIVDGNPSPKLTWNPAGEDRLNNSRLYYNATSRDKAVIHTCRATNNMVPTTGSPQQGSDSKELHISVLYSPIVDPFRSPVEVIEGQSLVVVCRADGNPSPKLTWNPAGEDNANKSTLYYSAISRNKAVIHTCNATNNMVPTSGSPQTGSDSKELLIDVLYNASISVFTSKDNIYVLNENSSLQILCQVDSNPYAVISLYLENELKLKVDNAQNLSYTNTVACLDAGTYKCTARNKIMNGDAVSRDLQINVTCLPRSDSRRNISTEHYGALGDNVTLEVYVIAYPEPTDITWYHRQNEVDIWQMLPYKSPSSSGLNSSIMIHLATERDFGYYMVNMSNNFGIYNNTYYIKPESKPGVPTNFTVAVNGPDSVTLEWTPGFGGGLLQYFIIQYRIFPDGAWVKYDPIWDSGLTKQTVIIVGLKQRTTYEFHLYAENNKGHSGNASVITTTTEIGDATVPVGVVAGSISGTLVAVVCVICILVFLRRQRQRSNREDEDSSTELKKKERTESGLVDNPVYDSSDPKPNPSTNSGAAGQEYAVVVKKKTENSSNIYAQVHKQKEQKKNGATKGKPGKTSRGDIYENADIVGRSPSKENVYANSDSVNLEPSGDNVYENPRTAASHNPIANKDDLLYADLMLDPPTTKNGKPVIRGMEDRTEYAEIAYGKRGDPLPDSIEEKKKN